MRLQHCALLLLALAAPALRATPATAQVITFVELADTILVQDDGLFVGITSTSNAEHAHVVAFVTVGGPGGVSGEPFGVAYMVEPPGAQYPGSISDSIQINVGHLGPGPDFVITLDFSSIRAGGPPVYPPTNFPGLVEDGTPQLLNSYFGEVGLPGGTQIWARADVSDVPTQVRHTSWGRIKAYYR